MGRPKLAVWKFASCDGCQLTLLDCEDELLAIADAVDIAHFLEATRAVVEGPYDISLVEGSITTAHDAERIRRMRDRLEAGLLRDIPYVQINGEHAPRLDNTLNLACHYIEGEGILYQLSSHGICASSGSACTSGSLEPSHVLRAMDVPFTAVHGSIRLSLSRYNTDEEIDRIIEVLPQIVRNLRKLSPYWDVEKNAPRPEAEKMLE